MAIHIQGGKDIAKSSIEENIQSMPFKISADCDAKVSTYFKPLVKVNEDSIYSSSFRGHPLSGKKLAIPDGYMGVVLHETVPPGTDKVDRNFYIVNKFDSFMHWNWDKTPTLNDPIMQALHVWIDVAEALHSS
ncbi:hypothetical protein PPYR_14678 [Photinus pyralis]|uniref:Uncharacterized protein n=1 Tax=Photinus pyralis TaxID=7054 RepID=A0A1Y1N9A1_PHOPY|nr:ribonuclease H2 subunit C [Photinus pyralis]KAB0792719.1 hypothetical protein PPYR_14678 [Photinus pyralis]